MYFRCSDCRDQCDEDESEKCSGCKKIVCVYCSDKHECKKDEEE